MSGRINVEEAVNGGELVFPVVDVWNNNANDLYEFHFCVRHPWQWVMEQVQTSAMTEVSSASKLPSAQQALQQQQAASASAAGSASVSQSPVPRRRRQVAKKSKNQLPATFRMEVVDKATQRVLVAWHGTSSAFDGLEDKDALVRTIQRCRAEDFHLSPPSVLLNWDVSLEECRNVIGPSLPALTTTASSTADGTTTTTSPTSPPFAVLKEPMGSQGQGIYFVRTVDEIHAIVDEQHQRARAQPDVLDSLIAAKNRIPSWVLQAEVNPSLLIRDGRKFHIRTYLVIVERPENDEVLDLYLYHQHEVRIAGVAVGETDGRDRLAHITNGALSNTTERCLLADEPELAHLQDSLQVFVADTFARHLLTDISRRVTSHPKPTSAVREFAVAGLDLMVTTDFRWYLLEVNVNPAAPPSRMVEPPFAAHLVQFWKSLLNLVAGTSTDGFLDTFGILEQAGITA